MKPGAKTQDKAGILTVDDFLAKPINAAELIARVRSLLKVGAYYKHMKNYRKELEIESYVLNFF